MSAPVTPAPRRPNPNGYLHFRARRIWKLDEPGTSGLRITVEPSLDPATDTWHKSVDHGQNIERSTLVASNVGALLNACHIAMHQTVWLVRAGNGLSLELHTGKRPKCLQQPQYTLLGMRGPMEARPNIRHDALGDYTRTFWQRQGEP